MDADTQSAFIGLWGVIIGAVVSLIASVVVPWIRDAHDRKRVARETLATERRDWLLATITALLEVRQHGSGSGPNPTGPALARFGAGLNHLTVRLTPDEQPIIDVLIAMLAMVQEPRSGISARVGEAMVVLTLWERGDIPTSQVISEVERRAGLVFAADRKTFGVAPPPQAP